MGGDVDDDRGEREKRPQGARVNKMQNVLEGVDKEQI